MTSTSEARRADQLAGASTTVRSGKANVNETERAADLLPTPDGSEGAFRCVRLDVRAERAAATLFGNEGDAFGG